MKAMQNAGDNTNSALIQTNDKTDDDIGATGDGGSGGGGGGGGTKHEPRRTDDRSAVGRVSPNGKSVTGKQMSLEDHANDENKATTTTKKSSNRNAINFMGNHSIAHILAFNRFSLTLITFLIWPFNMTTNK